MPKSITLRDTYELEQKEWVKKHNLKNGDHVKVVGTAVDGERGWCSEPSNDWTHLFDSKLKGTIGRIDHIGSGAGLCLYFDNPDLDGYWFPYFVLEPVNVGSEEGTTSSTTGRISWDDYFMEMAHLASKRSTCIRRRVGAVAVRDNYLLATGYNGAPSGLDHCDKTGCLREKLNVPSGKQHEICRGVHAEQNVITQAASHGVSLRGATIYVTVSPCSICARMLINAGVSRIVCAKKYPDDMALTMLEQAGIVVDERK